MDEVVEQLHQAVTSVLELDLDKLSDADLHELVVGLQRERDRLGAAAAQSLARWDGRTVWAGDRSRSAATRLARDTRCSLFTARTELRRARKSRSMPKTIASIAQGDLSVDHLDLLGRANQQWRDADFAASEEMLVEQCKKLRFGQARVFVDYWCQRADGVAAEERGSKLKDSAHLYASPTLDDTVALDGLLDPIGGAIVLKELDRLANEVRLADQGAGRDRTPAQRRVAALVEMATRSASTPADAQRPRPLFTVLLGDETFEQLCELANGVVLHPSQLAGWLTDAMLETVLFDGPSTVISVSHRRSFTGALRRAIEVRDRYCQHPTGCDTPADSCDVDHIVPVAKGGPTSQFNGRIECHPHNRDHAKHDHGAVPMAPRPVTRLDELRARIRWRVRHYYPDDDDDAASAAGQHPPGRPEVSCSVPPS